MAVRGPRAPRSTGLSAEVRAYCIYFCRSTARFPSLLLIPRLTSCEKPMSAARMEGFDMQAALNRATKSYKARVGNRIAWSAFYTWLGHSLDRCCPTPIAALRDVYHRLEQIATDPELLVCCTSLRCQPQGYRCISNQH